MASILIDSIEVFFPSVPYESLLAYRPTRFSYLMGWRCDVPSHTLTLSAVLHAGYDCGLYLRPPFPVPADNKCLFLVEHPSSNFIYHFEWMCRLLAGYKYVCSCPFNIAKGQMLNKIEDDVKDDNIALIMLKDRLSAMSSEGSAHGIFRD